MADHHAEGSMKDFTDPMEESIKVLHDHTCSLCGGPWGHDDPDCHENVLFECQNCINAFRKESARGAAGMHKKGEDKR